jgi:hypothetical protein
VNGSSGTHYVACSATDEISDSLTKLLGQVPAPSVTILYSEPLAVVEIRQKPKPSRHSVDQVGEIRLLVLTKEAGKVRNVV